MQIDDFLVFTGFQIRDYDIAQEIAHGGWGFGL
jgi:hypothetical protein